MTDGMGGPRGRSGKGKREEETNGGGVKAGGKEEGGGQGEKGEGKKNREGRMRQEGKRQ